MERLQVEVEDEVTPRCSHRMYGGGSKLVGLTFPATGSPLVRDLVLPKHLHGKDKLKLWMSVMVMNQLSSPTQSREL